ncbi:MAG: cell division protein FtsW [Bacteroidetes bacterium]|nr:MAG: cell division protein FtsW [Bacteroidota bacterium]
MAQTIKPSRFFAGDSVIWAVVFLLALFSILVVYSATGTLAYKRLSGDTEYYLFKHTILVLFSLVAMWICHQIDYKYYSRISRYTLLFSVPLLIFTWQYGTTINDATRWVTVPYINQTFQPSDLAKLALIANMASMLSKRQQSIKEFQRAILPILLWCGVTCGLIGLSDLSGAIILFATCMLLLFIGRVPVRYLFALVLVGVLAGTFALVVGQRAGTAKSRISAYLNQDKISFQAEQSYIAIATGGVFGKGPGNSDQRNFLPHPYSDFIFAVIVEEYGIFGAILVIVLYLTLLYRGMMTVSKSESAFGGLLSAGLSFSLVIQAMINMGVAVGVLPITGLQLPLLSMGGTSLLFTGVSIGIMISVSKSEDTFVATETGIRKKRIAK